jgi:hypothetical protein
LTVFLELEVLFTERWFPHHLQVQVQGRHLVACVDVVV